MDELSSYLGSVSSYDDCRAIVSRLKSCEVPESSVTRGASRECAAFINAHFNYGGCVNTHFNDADFRGTTWRAYLNQGGELWRSGNESIRLVDRDGKTVDIYSY